MRKNNLSENNGISDQLCCGVRDASSRLLSDVEKAPQVGSQRPAAMTVGLRVGRAEKWANYFPPLSFRQ